MFAGGRCLAPMDFGKFPINQPVQGFDLHIDFSNFTNIFALRKTIRFCDNAVTRELTRATLRCNQLILLVCFC